jgi:hypothetical protein
MQRITRSHVTTRTESDTDSITVASQLILSIVSAMYPTPAERLAALIGAESAREPIDTLAFWGHRPNRDGSVGPGCLSRWWPCRFTVDGAR